MVTLEEKSVIDRAKRIYEQLQSDLERDHRNRYVSIEPDSGEHFLGDTIRDAIDGALAKYPTRLSHVIRIGQRAALHIGGLTQ